MSKTLTGVAQGSHAPAWEQDMLMPNKPVFLRFSAPSAAKKISQIITKQHKYYLGLLLSFPKQEAVTKWMSR